MVTRSMVGFTRDMRIFSLMLLTSGSVMIYLLPEIIYLVRITSKRDITRAAIFFFESHFRILFPLNWSFDLKLPH